MPGRAPAGAESDACLDAGNEVRMPGRLGRSASRQLVQVPLQLHALARRKGDSGLWTAGRKAGLTAGRVIRVNIDRRLSAQFKTGQLA